MKTSSKSKTYAEIMSQPKVWKEIIDSSKKQFEQARGYYHTSGFQGIIFTGCGTTYALSLSAASLFRDHGFVAEAFPASEFAFYPKHASAQADLLVAFSRSGLTSETLWAVHAFRKEHPHGKVCAITTHTDSTLASLADFTLDASPAQEQSIGETRSFTGMLLLAQLFAANLRGDPIFDIRAQALPKALKVLTPIFSELAQRIAHSLPINRFFFLGGGALYGIACEAAFKIKEFTAGWGEAFHPLEFRHGPMSAINRKSLVVGLLSDGQMEVEFNVLMDAKAKGGNTLAIHERQGSLDLSRVDYSVALSTGLNEFERGVLYLPLIQLIAYYRCLASGLDPDNPHGLQAVTLL